MGRNRKDQEMFRGLLLFLLLWSSEIIPKIFFPFSGTLHGKNHSSKSGLLFGNGTKKQVPCNSLYHYELLDGFGVSTNALTESHE